MTDTTLEGLKRQLDLEGESNQLSSIPGDFYHRISAYAQKLRRSTGAGGSESANRLIFIQVRLIETMGRQLLELRARKAADQNAVSQLLAEERYLCSAQTKSKRRLDAFVDALASGKPSFIDFAQMSENRRSVTIKFVKHVNELVGMDMKRYGPFEVDDLASIPVAHANVLIAAGDAVEVVTREET
ncbi:MAG: DNA replication complex GINS family protein [Thaumarchaeota archaeon]|nr:DNA replication complex GINS family protein [Nitrososphaerota archaeon]